MQVCDGYKLIDAKHLFLHISGQSMSKLLCFYWQGPAQGLPLLFKNVQGLPLLFCISTDKESGRNPVLPFTSRFICWTQWRELWSRLKFLLIFFLINILYQQKKPRRSYRIKITDIFWKKLLREHLEQPILIISQLSFKSLSTRDLESHGGHIWQAHTTMYRDTFKALYFHFQRNTSHGRACSSLRLFIQQR